MPQRKRRKRSNSPRNRSKASKYISGADVATLLAAALLVSQGHDEESLAADPEVASMIKPDQKSGLWDLRGAQAPGANLQGLLLADSKLEYANLEGANLVEADLRNSILRSTKLNKANLKGASLRGARMLCVYLKEANLDKADLQDATLRAAMMQGASLRSANLQGADLQGANLVGADFTDADLRGARLYSTRMNFCEVALKGGTAPEVKFGGAIFDENTVFPDHFEPIEMGMVMAGAESQD